MATVFTLPFTPALGLNGLVEAGAKLTFYAPGTLTLKPVYSNPELTTPHANPVVADASGRFPDIYLSPAELYRIRLETALGVELGDVDEYSTTHNTSLTPQSHGAVGDGVTDDTTAFRAAWEEMLTTAKPLNLIDGDWVLTGALRAPIAANGEAIRVYGDGQTSARIINKLVGGAALIDLGDSLFSELRDFSIVGNGLTGAAGNGHAIIGHDPDLNAGSYTPQFASIRRVRVTDHLGTGAKYGGGTMPAQALYLVGALGTVVEHFFAKNNGGGIWCYKVNQPAFKDVTCDGNKFNGIVNEECERMVVENPDLVGGNDQSSAGSITMQDAVVLRAGDYVDYKQRGGTLTNPKIKNSVFSGLSLNSPEPTLVLGGWIALPATDGVRGAHVTKQAKIIGTEFSRFGPMAAGTRHDIYFAPSGGFRDIGLVSGTHHDFYGGGNVTSVITIDGVAATTSSNLLRGTIRDVTIGTDTPVANVTAVTDAIKVLGFIGNLTLDNIRVIAHSNVTITTAFNLASANNTAHGLTLNNCSAIVSPGSTGVVTAVVSGTPFPDYQYGLTSRGLEFMSRTNSNAIKDVMTKSVVLGTTYALTDAAWTLILTTTFGGAPQLNNALITAASSDRTAGLEFDVQVSGDTQVRVYAKTRAGILASHSLLNTSTVYLNAVELAG